MSQYILVISHTLKTSLHRIYVAPQIMIAFPQRSVWLVMALLIMPLLKNYNWLFQPTADVVIIFVKAACIDYNEKLE